MNSPADDRRVRKTKKALRQGLVSLLEKKKLKDITVRELTDTVDLHRGTFYVHYRDIYELYEKMWQEAIQEIRDIFRQYPPEEPGLGQEPRRRPAAPERRSEKREASSQSKLPFRVKKKKENGKTTLFFGWQHD